MTELPPEIAALLDRARRGHGPSESDRKRVLSNLHESLGMVVAPIVLTTPKSGPVATKTTGASHGAGAHGAAAHGAAHSGNALSRTLFTWKMGKIFLATVALGGAVSATQLPRSEPQAPSDRAREPAGRVVVTLAATEFEARGVRRRGERAKSHRAEPSRRAERAAEVAELRASMQESDWSVLATEPAASVSSFTPSVAAAPAPAPVDTSAPASDAAGRVAFVSTRARHSSSGQRAAEGSSDRAPSAERAPSARGSPPREISLIRGALSALRDGAPGRALALLDEHAQFYPRGAFLDERRGLRVLSLCAVGRRDEGERERDAFLDRASSSPIARRVRRACQEGHR